MSMVSNHTELPTINGEAIASGFLLAEVKSLGAAYQILNALPNTTRVLDFGPIGDAAILLLQDSEEALAKINISIAETQCLAKVLLPPKAKPAIDAYFSLTNSEIGTSMIVAESISVVKIFQLAVYALENSATLLELRKIRGHRGLAYLCCSPASSPNGTLYCPSWFDGGWTEINPVSASLKNYF